MEVWNLITYGKTMVLWKKNLVQWKKLWYYTVYEGFTKRKTWLITKNYESLIYNEKKYGYIPKQLFLTKSIALEV